jgi:O-antigen ligase
VKTWDIGRLAELICIALLVAAFSLIQVLIGGTRLIFSLPAYVLLAAMGLVTILLARRRVGPAPEKLCLVSSVLFFGYIILRAMTSPVAYLARADIYSVLGGLLVYLFVACICVDNKRRMWFICALFAIAFVHVGIGVVQFRYGDDFMLIPFLQRFEYGRRASGFYICPNHLAGLLEVLGIFGLSLVCWARWPVWGKLLVLYATCVCYLGLILTASRGGYISTAGSIVVFLTLSLLVLRRVDKRAFARIGLTLTIAAFVVLAVGWVAADKTLFSNDRVHTLPEETNDLRLDLWKTALEQWKLEPTLGTGSGTYLFYGRRFRSDRMDRDPVEVHNDYLHLLCEYGIAGATLFLLFLGAHLHLGWRNFRQLGPRRVAVSGRFRSNSMALQIGALAAVGAYLVHSVFDFNLHIPANALLLAFVFGLLANAGVMREATLQRPRKSQILPLLVLPILSVVVMIQSLRLLPGEYFAEKSRTSLRDGESAASVYYALRGLRTERCNPNLFYYLGCGLVTEGNATTDVAKRASLFEAAILAFQSGRALAPQDRTFALELGPVYDARGRFSEGEWMYDEALRLDPKFQLIKEAYRAHLDQWRQAREPLWMESMGN